MYACDLKPIVSDIMELLQWFFLKLVLVNFNSICKKHKIPYFMAEKGFSGFLVIVTELMTHAHPTAIYISYI